MEGQFGSEHFFLSAYSWSCRRRMIPGVLMLVMFLCWLKAVLTGFCCAAVRGAPYLGHL